MRFVWFWTFWHWSKESFRSGSLLRGPLEGVGSHWDEWYRHEASQSDHHAIEEAGRSETSQREFIAWLFLHWAPEANLQANRLAPRFVVGQLANLPPFTQWAAFAEYRASYGIGGVSAIVLAEGSAGESEDVRQIEGMALPPAPRTASPLIIAEGFHAEATELEAPRRAALSLLCGKGLLALLALWIAGGRRPYPRWFKITLSLGWAVVGTLIVYLLVGPDLDEHLLPTVATLVGLWAGLVMIGLAVIGTQCFRAWRVGKNWRTQLEESQVRFRMDGGLTLRGGSAGLPFCLNTLLALYRAHPPTARHSWLWQSFFRKLHTEAAHWAATGVITPAAGLQPVVLDPKFRACLQHAAITTILTPRQREAGRQGVTRIASALTSTSSRRESNAPTAAITRLGFAAEQSGLRSHQCRHVAQAIMAIAGFSSKWQAAVNILAVVVSAIMLLALADVRSILRPPPPPTAVSPSSPSPYYLWVSLDTPQPRYFQAVLESDFWANRRVDVSRYSGANASVRAEILLHRMARENTATANDGTVWIERRRRFLTREFSPGERVGRYSISYLNRLGHE